MVRGVFVSRKEAENTTQNDALDRYEREVSSKKKGYGREKTRIKNWRENDLAKRSLASIRGSDIAKYRDTWTHSGYAANTVRLELAVLSHLFETARKEWGMEGLSNPVKSIRIPSPPEGRDRRLKPGELEKLLDNSPEELGRIIRFALETGMRRSEIAGMTWKHVDLKNGWSRCPKRKTGPSESSRSPRNPSGSSPTSPEGSMGRCGGLDQTRSLKISPKPVIKRESKG